MVVAAAAPGRAAALPNGKSKAPPTCHLSLGDSYSIGYKPDIGPTPGFTAYVAQKTKIVLENFGCGGATTTSILTVIGCTSPYGPQAVTDAAAYPTTTQEQPAVDFIDANPGQVGLITISIGGNDVTVCASNPDPTSCVVTAESTIGTNVTSRSIRCRAPSPATATPRRRSWLTYPDVILGAYVYPPGDNNVTLANESVAAFDDPDQPDVEDRLYIGDRGELRNVTSARYKRATSGDDTPLTKLVSRPSRRVRSEDPGAPSGLRGPSVRRNSEIAYEDFGPDALAPAGQELGSPRIRVGLDDVEAAATR